jgi:tetratricopeptide (TPR) repeat protein
MNSRKSRWVVVCSIAAILQAPWCMTWSQTGSADDDPYADIYDEFRRMLAVGRIADSLPLAHELVQLNMEPGREAGLAKAYSDLGAVQLRLGQAHDAETSFNRALELLSASDGIASPRLIGPLTSLAAALQSQGKLDAARDTLQHAIAVSRRAYGLFDIRQMPLLDSMFELHESLGDVAGSERLLRYSLEIVVQSYGPEDPRVLPLMQRFAEWSDRNNRDEQARDYWARIAKISGLEDGGRNAVTVTALIAIARSHRLQYVRDPVAVGLRTCPAEATWSCTDLGRPIKLNRAGEDSALEALDLLHSTAEPPPALLISALLELGDWYLTAHQPERAIPYYRSAWPLIAETFAPPYSHPLMAPIPLDYRPPPESVEHRQTAGSTAYPIEFSLTVNADGTTADVTASIVAAPTWISKLTQALERARFRPRFENGQPVATQVDRHIVYWYGLPAPITR